MLIIEGSGKINKNGDGFALPISKVLNKINIKHQIVNLDYELNLLKSLENEILSKKIPVIISGSFYDLKSKLEWYIYLKSFILKLLKNNNPILGICFGAQVIFDCVYPNFLTFGNVSEVGVINIKNNDSSILKNLKHNNFYTYHSDGILYSKKHLDKIEPIYLSTVGKKKIYQAYKIKEKKVFGLQFHPEFDYDSYIEMLSLYEKNFNNTESIIKNLLKLDSNVSIFENFKELIDNE